MCSDSRTFEQVLFDTLKFHGAAFTPPFWARVFDSVLLPIFDHVRAEVRLPCHQHIVHCLTAFGAWLCRTTAVHDVACLGYWE